MCNCPQNNVCPMDKRYFAKNIVYEGKVVEHPVEESRDYIGLTSTEWKKRESVHNQGINHRCYSNRCELTKHIWNLKDDSKEYTLSWRILKEVKRTFD